MPRRGARLSCALACLSVLVAACGSSSSHSSGHPAASPGGSLSPASVASRSPTGPASTARGTGAAPESPARSGSSGRPTPNRPCGFGGRPAYTHVVWIWMENKDYGAVIGNPGAPYENALARRCGLATDYRGITHPSLPNYLAAVGGSTFGVRDDASPAAHPVAGDSLFGQLARRGLSWRSYQESMGRRCSRASAGSYAVKHNPAAYFTTIRSACRRADVPLAGHLAQALSAGRLPAFSFITPNLCHDTHDCSVAVGDAWLKTWVTRIIHSPDYRWGRTLLVVTWDEGVGRSNRVPALVIAPTVPSGTHSGRRLNHYSLLRATEDVLGLPHLRHAKTAASMTGAFRLTR